jgi:nonsense-mediated mRNA decay protein 3
MYHMRNMLYINEVMNDMARYCVKCGREVGEDEPLIDGMCIDCYLKYKGVFISKPVLEITICPRCGSWRYRGEWRDPLPIKEVIRRVLLGEAHRFIDKRHVEVVDAVITSDPVRINESQYSVKALLQVLVEEHYPVSINAEIILSINKKICPRCLAHAGKSNRALVQIRSSDGIFSSDERRIIEKALSDPGVIHDIVEVKEVKHGIDVKLLTSVSAKRLSTILNRLTGAKVTESFRPTRYNPDKGRWQGITTLSVRLPSIRKGDLVEYEGRFGVVRDVTPHGVRVEFLEKGNVENINYDKYWSGKLRKSEKIVYGEEYRVIAVDKTTIYLLNEKTGEITDYPRKGSVNKVLEGDRVKAVRIRDKVYMIKYSGIGEK